MHISRKPVILEQQMSSFGKHLSLFTTLIHGYCEISNMKLNTWPDTSSKYIEGFCHLEGHCFHCYGYIVRKISILSGFFPLAFGISLAMVKTDVKNILPKSFFFQTLAVFFFLLIYVICLPRTSWVLCLKQKVFHSLCSEI